MQIILVGALDPDGRDLAAPVPNELKETRWHRFMQHQQAISRRRLERKVGTRQQVVIDEIGSTVAKGRSKAGLSASTVSGRAASLRMTFTALPPVDDPVDTCRQRRWMQARS